MAWREFNRDLAERMGMRVKDAELVTDAVLELVKERLERGERVSFRRFGSFSVVRMERRRFRNPRTGEPIEAPARRRVKFSTSRTLRKVLSHVE